MILAYEISLDDYQRANWLHIRPRRTIRIAGVIIVLLAGVVFAFMSLSLIRTGKHLGIVTVLGASIVYFVMFFSVLFPKYTRRAYGRQRIAEKTHFLELLDQGMVSRTDDSRSNSFSWRKLKQWKMDKHLIIIYVSQKRFMIVPQHAFSSLCQFHAFRDLVHQKLGPPLS